MKRIVWFVLLAGGMGVAPQEAQAQHWRAMYGPGHHWYGPSYQWHAPAYQAHAPAYQWHASAYQAHAPTYHCGPGAYSMSTYYAPPVSVASAGRTVEVGAYDGRGFLPKTITVAPGTTVRWVNHGKEHHTVTSRDGRFDSGMLSPGATYSVTFTRPGTFEYFCRPHERMGMVGTVVVAPGGHNGSGAQTGGSSY